MKAHLEVALVGIAAGGPGSTSACSAVTGTLARHTFCAGHVRKEMPQRLESSTAAYGRSGEMDASFARPP
jgi:hypothetical protein